MIYKKHEKGIVNESVKLLDENGKCFQLNKDLTIKKCDDDDNENGVQQGCCVKKKTKSVSQKNII